MNITVDGVSVYSGLHFSAAIVTLLAAIVFNVYFKNILSARKFGVKDFQSQMRVQT